MKIKLKLKTKNKLIPTLKFSKDFALRNLKIGYYEARQEEIETLPKKKEIKKKYATPKSIRVSTALADIRKEFEKNKGIVSKVWQILKNIYNKRIYNNTPVNNLMSIITNENFLLMCYKRIRANKGANTKATQTPYKMKKNMTQIQQRMLVDNYFTPDGMSLELIRTASKLLKEGKYPWGISKRIQVESPPGKMRPITIPPFMDKVIQEGITKILQAIYEPVFEKMNRSFGFRPNKSVHDAIYSIKRRNNCNLNMAIEGDIKGAYNKVSRNILLNILREEIKDSKFIKLIKTRLQYCYFDTVEKKYVEEQEGIPQGGIDSPYLWNIYMLKFDKFILSHLKTKTENMNEIRDTTSYTITSKETNLIKKRRANALIRIRLLNKKEEISQLMFNNMISTIIIYPKWFPNIKLNMQPNEENRRLIKRALIRIRLNLKNKLIRIESRKPKRDLIRFHYTRYADDFIILGNYNEKVANEIKQEISEHLKEELKATLSLEKTLITNLKKKKALFLGFSLYIRESKKIIRRKVPIKKTLTHQGKTNTITIRKEILQRANTSNIVVGIDEQRKLNRMYIHHMCNKEGHPTSIPWITYLELFTIIERYNSIMTGMCNFFIGFINDKSDINRWLYILRYSCYLTIARKYRISIRKVLSRFKYKKTIRCVVTQNIPDEKGTIRKYQKTWTLLTNKELINNALNTKRYETVKKRFEDIEAGILVEYKNTKTSVPSITSTNYLKTINWVNLRTRSSFDLPCFKCGRQDNIEMHHIKGIRTRLLKDSLEWEKIMSLRNRNQMPICRQCHSAIHNRAIMINKKMKTPKLVDTEKGYDNRLINIENQISKTWLEVAGKTLAEKGWEEINHTI